MGPAHAGLDPSPGDGGRPRGRRLLALSDGEEAYEDFTGWATWKWALIVWVPLSWALFQHTLSGLRHLVMDIGAGYELSTNKFWANMTIIGSLLLTAVLWAWILFGRAA